MSHSNFDTYWSNFTIILVNYYLHIGYNILVIDILLNTYCSINIHQFIFVVVKSRINIHSDHLHIGHLHIGHLHIGHLHIGKLFYP